MSLIIRLKIAGLNVLKVSLYIVCLPIVLVFGLYGIYFIVTAFLWIVLLEAAVVTGILVFCANFFMFFAALFNGNIWGDMGGMWTWLWSWFAAGNISLWPHFVTSLPPYFISGLVSALLCEGANRLTLKAKSIKRAAVARV
jgi:hypothetical protein